MTERDSCRTDDAVSCGSGPFARIRWSLGELADIVRSRRDAWRTRRAAR